MTGIVGLTETIKVRIADVVRLGNDPVPFVDARSGSATPPVYFLEPEIDVEVDRDKTDNYADLSVAIECYGAIASVTQGAVVDLLTQAGEALDEKSGWKVGHGIQAAYFQDVAVAPTETQYHHAVARIRMVQ